MQAQGIEILRKSNMADLQQCTPAIGAQPAIPCSMSSKHFHAGIPLFSRLIEKAIFRGRQGGGGDGGLYWGMWKGRQGRGGSGWPGPCSRLLGGMVARHLARATMCAVRQPRISEARWSSADMRWPCTFSGVGVLHRQEGSVPGHKKIHSGLAARGNAGLGRNQTRGGGVPHEDVPVVKQI